MKTKNILFVIVLFSFFLLNIVSAPILTAQSLKNNFDPNEKKDIFQRVETALSPNALQVNFYPIADGDFWEYITADTTTLLGQFYGDLKFSITKEITGDTLMTNGITYKKIKWENIANSVNYPEWYDYHRVDTTGNVHLFFEGTDYLLFDFSLAIGQSYPSHLPNHTWKIVDRYEVIGFGDTLQAINFELLEQGTISKEKYSFVENLGMFYYQQNITDYAMPKGNFWGAVIDGEEYGTMIATKQTVDWSEFYPLHIGDYWVYEGQLGFLPTLNSVRIINDTLMPDGNIYFKSLDIDHTFGYTSYSYKRIDSSGIVSIWEYWNSTSKNILAFSAIVGDSTLSQYQQLVHRVDNKASGGIYFFLYPDLTFQSSWYFQGIGRTNSTFEGGYEYLTGAYVNGILYGDTTVTQVDGNHSQIPNAIVLYQNYPNPFNPSTTISFSIPERSFVTLKVYDILGREVVPWNGINEELEPGSFEKTFDASTLSSGVYIYRITVMKDGKILFSESRQMLLIK